MLLSTLTFSSEVLEETLGWQQQQSVTRFNSFQVSQSYIPSGKSADMISKFLPAGPVLQTLESPAAASARKHRGKFNNLRDDICGNFTHVQIHKGAYKSYVTNPHSVRECESTFFPNAQDAKNRCRAIFQEYLSRGHFPPPLMLDSLFLSLFWLFIAFWTTLNCLYYCAPQWFSRGHL